MAVDLLPHLSGDKYWSPAKWKPRHRLIIALHCGGDGNKEIEEKLGLSANTVSAILNDPRAVYEIEHLAKSLADHVVDAGVRLKLYANEALDEIVEEMRTAKNVQVRQRAAFGILDRAGFTAVTKERETTAPLLPEDVVERMEKATRELIEYDGVYTEVEPQQAVDDGPTQEITAPPLIIQGAKDE